MEEEVPKLMMATTKKTGKMLEILEYRKDKIEIAEIF